MNRIREAMVVSVLCVAALCMGTVGASADEETDEYPSALADDERRPLWEAGVLFGGACLPHYRGSDEYNYYVVPIPYVIYRGKRLRLSRHGLRGRLLWSEHFETALSVYGNPPVDDDNRARRGMPELDPIVEFGPLAKWYFTAKDAPDLLYLNAVARAVWAIEIHDDFGVDYVGVHGGIHLRYRNRTFFEKTKWQFGLNAGIDISDRGYNGYFYDVAREYVTDDRPAFHSRGGYSGFWTSATVTKRLSPRFSVGSFVRWEGLWGAVTEESQLVKRDNQFVGGAALVWHIAKSKRKAPTMD